MERYSTILVWLVALGSLLISGVFLAFSSFVMAALQSLSAKEAISAMNAINVTVINPLFMTIFLGTGILAILVIVSLIAHPTDHRSVWAILGSLVYLLGSIGVTMALNVPLNNALAVGNPDSGAAAELWQHYASSWTFWNHVRCLASLLAGIILVSALP